MIKFVQRLITHIRVQRAIKEAAGLAQSSGRKTMVIMYQQKPVVITKQNVTTLVRRRYFGKGTTVQDVERRALFISK